MIKTIILTFNLLFQPNEQKIQAHIKSQLNWYDYVSLAVQGIPKKDEIKNEIFSILNSIQCETDTNCYTQYPSYESNGQKFPTIFCRMFTSKTLDEEKAILKKIMDHLSTISHRYTNARLKILTAVIETIFQTHYMNKFITPCSFMLDCAQTLKNAGYTIIIIGNVPGYAWSQLVNQYSKKDYFTNLFHKDSRFISGELGILKTSDKIYELILKKHTIKSQECLVIDNHSNNLACFQQLGMLTMTLDPFHNTSKQFKTSINKILNKKIF